MSDATSPESSHELQVFHLQNGSVIGEATQQETEAFAADMQGLRHFGEKLGTGLELGTPWHGAFREADFTHLWACTTEATGPKDPAVGGTLGRHAPFYELIETLTTADLADES